MTTNTQEETGTESVVEHFGSKTEGFSNPNLESTPEAFDVPLAKNEDSESEEKPYTYSERLEKLKITDEEAHQIIDAICEEGSYMEASIIRKKRKDKKEIKAVFLTRDTRSQAFISIEAAKRHGNIPMVFEKIMGELQLAASLIHYNGVKYDSLSALETDEEFEKEIMKRVHIFSKLPAPITVVLTRKLGDFDLKVTAVMAPGYEDFF